MRELLYILVGIWSLFTFISCSEDKEDINNEIILDISADRENIGVNQFCNLSVKSNLSGCTYKWSDNDSIFERGDSCVKWKPLSTGEHIIEVHAEKDHYCSSITKRINVKECDFGIGQWGNSKEDICEFEDGVLVSGSINKLVFKGGTLDMMVYTPCTDWEKVYFFDNEKRLNKGMKVIHTFWEVYDMSLPFYDFKQTTEYFVGLYGNYISSSLTQIGESEYDYINAAKALINGDIILSSYFETERSIIELKFYKRDPSYTYSKEIIFKMK